MNVGEESAQIPRRRFMQVTKIIIDCYTRKNWSTEQVWEKRILLF